MSPRRILLLPTRGMPSVGLEPPHRDTICCLVLVFNEVAPLFSINSPLVAASRLDYTHYHLSSAQRFELEHTPPTTTPKPPV